MLCLHSYQVSLYSALKGVTQLTDSLTWASWNANYIYIPPIFSATLKWRRRRELKMTNDPHSYAYIIYIFFSSGFWKMRSENKNAKKAQKHRGDKEKTETDWNIWWMYERGMIELFFYADTHYKHYISSPKSSFILLQLVCDISFYFIFTFFIIFFVVWVNKTRSQFWWCKSCEQPSMCWRENIFAFCGSGLGSR